jgi:hypothetical protein
MYKCLEKVDTSYSKGVDQVADAVCNLPTDKSINKIKRSTIEKQCFLIQTSWIGEWLSIYGSLLQEGFDVRISGQDT